MSVILITAKTAAETSAAIVGVKSGSTKVVSASGLTGGEYVDILVEHGAGFVTTGDANRLTATVPFKVLSGSANYKVAKSVTVSPVSVALAV